MTENINTMQHLLPQENRQEAETMLKLIQQMKPEQQAVAKGFAEGIKVGLLMAQTGKPA